MTNALLPLKGGLGVQVGVGRAKDQLCFTMLETSVFQNWSQSQEGWKILCMAKSSRGSFEYIPNIVQDKPFSRVEAGSDVPLLPHN